jgi:hypothetical protein
LLHASPEVLSVPDPFTKLYPFQVAAIPVGDTTVELDTIYHLLRSKPDVLGFFDFEKQDEDIEIITEPTREASDRFPAYIQDTLLCTLTAILIGSLGGVVFGE